MKWKKKCLALISAALLVFSLTACNSEVQNEPSSVPPASSSVTSDAEESQPISSEQPEASSESSMENKAPAVYMTTDISPESLIQIYEALNREATGNVAVKISTG